jgi:hypothetical protein
VGSSGPMGGKMQDSHILHMAETYHHII